MAQAMPLHASAARLWLLSTLSCRVSCMWPPEVSDAVLCSPLRSCRSIVSFVFPSFWLHVHSRCMQFLGIVRSSSDSDVQSIVDACSKVLWGFSISSSSYGCVSLVQFQLL